MMTGLSIVLGTSLILFVGSLVCAMLQDWFGAGRSFHKIIAEHVAQASYRPMQRNFHRAARRPTKILGRYIF